MKPIVHTQVVSRRPLYKSINLFGQLKAKAQIDIVNKYAGIVDEINVDLGSKVQAGDILLVQHLDDARAEMLKAKARYAEAGANAATTDVSYSTSLTRYEADYKLAQVNAERYRKLYAQGAVSKSELDSMEQTLANKKRSTMLWRSRKAMMAHRRRSTVRIRLLPDVSRSTLLRKTSITI